MRGVDTSKTDIFGNAMEDEYAEIEEQKSATLAKAAKARADTKAAAERKEQQKEEEYEAKRLAKQRAGEDAEAKAAADAAAAIEKARLASAAGRWEQRKPKVRRDQQKLRCRSADHHLFTSVPHL